MSAHYPDYSQACDNVAKMDIDSLLGLIDDLYGRDRLRYGDGVEAVRREALRQLDREWTDTKAANEQGDWKALAKAVLEAAR